MPEWARKGGGHGTLRLLGEWQLTIGGVDVALNHREQRLTALLGLTGRSSRLHVAGTLWPESTDERALASLRRAVLQTQQRSPGLLRADRTDIGLDPAIEVDVDELRRAAGLTELPMPGREAETLLEVLVGEQVLPAWYDDWVFAERERTEQMRVRALERIARNAFELGDLVQAIAAARAAVDIEPLLESARELTIRAHLGQGEHGSALREFHRYRDAMSSELGVAPSSSILGLVEPVLAAQAAEGARGEVEAPVVVPRPRAELTPVAPEPPPQPPPQPVPPVPPVPPIAPAPPAAPGLPALEPVTTGFGMAAVRLLAVAVLILAASLALAGGGPEAGGEGTRDPGAAARPTGDVPAPGLPGVAAGASPPGNSALPRAVRVRAVDAAHGSAAFVVRATLRPATVRVLVRGPSGSSVERGLVVRRQEGRRLVLDGLVAGTYRWLATSPTATPVRGQMTVTERPEPVMVTPSPTPTPSPSPSPTPTPSPSPTPTPTPTPTQQTIPVASSSPTPAAPSAPSPQRPPKPRPTNSPQSSPTGTPTDPGTVAPMPVG